MPRPDALGGEERVVDALDVLARMPSPVSATSTTTASSSARVARVSQPPRGMASRAFRIRLKNTCCRRFSLPRTAGRSSASSLRTLMRAPVELVLEQREHVEQDLVDVERLELGAARAREVQQVVDDLGRAEGLLLDLLQERPARVRRPTCSRSIWV